MHIYGLSIAFVKLVTGEHLNEHKGFFESESDALEEAYHLADIHFSPEWHCTARYVDPRGWEPLYAIYPMHLPQGMIRIEQIDVITEHDAQQTRNARLGFEINEDWKRHELLQMQAIDDFFDELSY